MVKAFTEASDKGHNGSVMVRAGLSEEHATVIGRRKIRNSQAAALIAGSLFLASDWLTWGRWPLGLLVGLIYSNAFEYFTHRILLHRTTGYLYKGHERHHLSWGREDEGLYVRFGPPVAVIGLFTLNSVPLVLLDRLGAGIGAGAFIGFLAYYVLYEELHWRIHLGYLPPWLAWMRKHHFAHHKGVEGKYSVLLPVWDRVFESTTQILNPKS